MIQQLLAENGKADVSADVVSVSAAGAEAASDTTNVMSPETYVGYERARRTSCRQVARSRMPATFMPRALPRLNEWGLSGDWTVHSDLAVLNEPGGGITYRFHARDLHLVLGTTVGKPVRFRVTIDGSVPGDSHGADVDADGQGTVTAQRLYQLVRQNGPVGDHTFEIPFLDPGVEAYAFTFG